MKNQWVFVALAAGLLPACDKKEQPVPTTLPSAERKTPAPTKIEPVVDSSPAPQAPAKEQAAAESPAAPAPDRTPTPAPAPPAPSNQIPVAKPVEGQPGFVFSPYNDKIVDVRDMSSGMLVADPSFPASEKKHFRTP